MVLDLPGEVSLAEGAGQAVVRNPRPRQRTAERALRSFPSVMHDEWSARRVPAA